jgi:hypothetical protein
MSLTKVENNSVAKQWDSLKNSATTTWNNRTVKATTLAAGALAVGATVASFLGGPALLIVGLAAAAFAALAVSCIPVRKPQQPKSPTLTPVAAPKVEQATVANVSAKKAEEKKADTKSKTFVQRHPYGTAFAAVALTGAVGYGAYRVYPAPFAATYKFAAKLSRGTVNFFTSFWKEGPCNVKPPFACNYKPGNFTN